MKKRNLMSVLSILLTAMLVLTACGGNPPADSDQSETGGEEGAGENTQITTQGETTQGTGSGKTEMIFAMANEPSSLNPGEFGDQFSKLASMQIYETLVRESIADRTVLEPLLAESWEFDETGTVLTFKIKEGVKFHNGDELTAEDVAFSLNKNINEPANLALSSMMKDAVVVDDTHVALNLEYAYNPVLSILAIPSFAIINKAYYEQCEADGTNFGRSPIGTGPYVFESWTAGSNVAMKANDNWHGGDVAVKDLEFRIMTDATTAAIALETGDVDVFFGVDSADLPRLRENDDVNVLSVQSAGFYFMAMNESRAPFDDVRVRQAINYCVDRQDIIDGGQDGVGWATYCPITPGVFGHQENFRSVEQDFEKAKELLAEAGYPDGLSFSMICPETSYYARPAQVLQEQLRQAGITVDLQIMERGAFNTQMADGDFDTCYYWVGATYPDADAIVYNMFHKSFANQPGEQNLSNVVSEEATSLVERARVSMDNDERYELYGELSQLNDDNAWYVTTLTSTNTLCARVDVAGAYGHSAAMYHVADWSF